MLLSQGSDDFSTPPPPPRGVPQTRATKNQLAPATPDLG